MFISSVFGKNIHMLSVLYDMGKESRFGVDKFMRKIIKVYCNQLMLCYNFKCKIITIRGGLSMDETRYIISDASKKVDVEQHTLRYWEDELKLDIPRNEMGHRYYRDEDIELLRKIKVLKEQGFQLKAIKMLLPEMDKLEVQDPTSIVKLRDELMEREEIKGIDEMEPKNNLVANTEQNTVSESGRPEKISQFRVIMSDIITEALKDNNEIMSDTVSMNVTNSVIKEMDYLMRLKEEREEERFKKFDQVLREYQNGKSRSAATKEKKSKKGLFRK